MYHAHFGLERSLFGEGIATDAAVFRTARHDRLIAHFKLALAAPNSVVVLRGHAGVGKTTLTSHALRMTTTRLALAWLGGAATNPSELLELLLVELGVNTLRTTRVERVQLWRQFQGEMRATDSRLFIVVERTEDLSHEVLHALDQLTAPDASGNPGANLVLLGNEGLDAHLGVPLLDSLRQRIRYRAVLEPFTEAELQDYLRHQTACAGGNYDRIFAPGAVAALFRYSRGVARLANNLCESTLDVAAVQQHPQLTADLVARTAVSVLGLEEPVPVPHTAPAALAETPAAPVDRRAMPRMPAASLEQQPLAPQAAASTPSPAAAQTPVASVAPQAVAAPPATVAVAPAAAPPPPPAVAPPPPAATFAPLPPATAAPPPAATAAAPAPTAAPSPAASAPPTTTNPAAVEYDGGATDVADVALADFPVLTDAVDEPLLFEPAQAKPAPAAAEPAKPVVAAPPPAAAAAAERPRASAPQAAPQAAPKPVSRIETAYTARQPASAAPAAASPAPPPVAPKPIEAPKPAAAAPHEDPADEDDLLRQTQTLRAIAVAKSIDDISSSMAETLFSDAELDLVAAALAAEWPDDADEAAEGPAAQPAKPASAEVATVDDAFDLFGLGDDAPLELIDDSALPANRGKTAAR